MARVDITTFKSNMRTKIFENTTGAVTATNVQEVFDELADSVNWTMQQQGMATVTTTPTAVIFAAPMASTNYNVQLTPMDAQGEPMDVAITNIATTGFNLTGAVSGNCYWKVSL